MKQFAKLFDLKGNNQIVFMKAHNMKEQKYEVEVYTHHDDCKIGFSFMFDSQSERDVFFNSLTIESSTKIYMDFVNSYNKG